MALETVFGELSVSLARLNDALDELNLTIDDLPRDSDSALADDLAGRVMELLGGVQEARSEAALASKTPTDERELGVILRSLSKCQQRFLSVQNQVFRELSAYLRLRELERLSEAKGGEWRPWATAIADAIDRCQGEVQRTSEALAACWPEVAALAAFHSGK